MDQKSEMNKLGFLIGKWNTHGIMRATDESPELKINGTDTYEWVSNGFFILHTVNVMMGDQNVQAVEIIGFDDKLKKYSMQSFDNAGEITFMNANFDNQNAFVLVGETTRAILTVDISVSEMKAFWEQSEDGKSWIPWMDINLTK